MTAQIKYTDVEVGTQLPHGLLPRDAGHAGPLRRCVG